MFSYINININIILTLYLFSKHNNFYLDLLLTLYNISNICTDIYVGICPGGQHDSDLSGLSARLQRSIIMYTYNFLSTVLLCTQLILNKCLSILYLQFSVCSGPHPTVILSQVKTITIGLSQLRTDNDK